MGHLFACSCHSQLLSRSSSFLHQQSCCCAHSSIMLNSWRQQHDTSMQVSAESSDYLTLHNNVFTMDQIKCGIAPCAKPEGFFSARLWSTDLRWNQNMWFYKSVPTFSFDIQKTPNPRVTGDHMFVCVCMCRWSIQTVSQMVTTRNRKQLPPSHPALPLTQHTPCQFGEDSLPHSAE